MPPNSCPTPETLRDWALGNLSDVQSDVVLDHIDVCPQCEELLSRVEVLQQIDQFDDTNDFRREAECTDLVNLLSGTASSMPTGDAKRDDLSGLRIRDYRLIKQLGRGGMGTVYQARHMRLNKLVAIKLVPEHSHEDPSALARFEREMQAVGLLDHPNVVSALDAGDADGMYFLTMELVEGTDLSQLIKRKRQLSAADACEIIRQAADGMQYAHEQGLIHRDIKPSNLMLAQDQDGGVVVKILDLGLATMPDTAESITAVTDQDLLVGTLEYMAPEQCDDSTGIDHRADIYSLGATLYRLLTGSIPFSGPQFRKPARRLFALTTLDAPAIATRRDDLPRELAQFVDGMLARDRTFRPMSMAEVSNTLAEFSSSASLKKLLADLPGPETEAVDEQTIQSDALHPAAALADTSPTAARTISEVRPGTPLAAHSSINEDGHSGRWKWLALAAIVPATILTAVLWIVNNGGYIRVEHADDIDLQLEVIRNGKPSGMIDLKQTDKAVFYRAGNYEFRIPADKRNSIRLENGSFYLKRNGRQVVRISHVAQRVVPEPMAKHQVPTTMHPTPVPNPRGTVPAIVTSPMDANQADELQRSWAEHLRVPVTYENSIGMSFQLIPPGEFLMGAAKLEHAAAVSTAAEERPSRMNPDREVTLIHSEAPQRSVQLTQPFYMATYEVRERDFDQLVTRKRPFKVQSPDHPVGLITWLRAALFCNELSKRESMPLRYEIDGRNVKILEQKRGYRLPTEAEWEFACRAGTVSAYPFGNDAQKCSDYAWYIQTSDDKTSHANSFAAGQKKPNQFGLFDMLGNHWEWCEDANVTSRNSPVPWVNPLFHEPAKHRIGRGGFVLSIATDLRSARRRSHLAHMPYPHGGFRVVLSLGPDSVGPIVNPIPQP